MPAIIPSASSRPLNSANLSTKGPLDVNIVRSISIVSRSFCSTPAPIWRRRRGCIPSDRPTIGSSSILSLSSSSASAAATTSENAYTPAPSGDAAREQQGPTDNPDFDQMFEALKRSNPQGAVKPDEEQVPWSASDLDPEGVDITYEDVLQAADASAQKAGEGEELYGPPAVVLAGFRVEEYAMVRTYLDAAGGQGIKVLPADQETLHRYVDDAIQLPEIDWSAARPPGWLQGAAWGAQRCVLFSGMSLSAQATMLELMEGAGLPLLCCATASLVNGHRRVGDVLAEAIKELRRSKTAKQNWLEEKLGEGRVNDKLPPVESLITSSVRKRQQAVAEAMWAQQEASNGSSQPDDTHPSGREGQGAQVDDADVEESGIVSTVVSKATKSMMNGVSQQHSATANDADVRDNVLRAGRRSGRPVAGKHLCNAAAVDDVGDGDSGSVGTRSHGFQDGSRGLTGEGFREAAAGQMGSKDQAPLAEEDEITMEQLAALSQGLSPEVAQQWMAALKGLGQGSVDDGEDGVEDVGEGDDVDAMTQADLEAAWEQFVERANGQGVGTKGEGGGSGGGGERGQEVEDAILKLIRPGGKRMEGEGVEREEAQGQDPVERRVIEQLLKVKKMSKQQQGPGERDMSADSGVQSQRQQPASKSIAAVVEGGVGQPDMVEAERQLAGQFAAAQQVSNTEKISHLSSVATEDLQVPHSGRTQQQAQHGEVAQGTTQWQEVPAFKEEATKNEVVVGGSTQDASGGPTRVDLQPNNDSAPELEEGEEHVDSIALPHPFSASSSVQSAFTQSPSTQVSSTQASFTQASATQPCSTQSSSAQASSSTPLPSASKPWKRQKADAAATLPTAAPQSSSLGNNADNGSSTSANPHSTSAVDTPTPTQSVPAVPAVQQGADEAPGASAFPHMGPTSGVTPTRVNLLDLTQGPSSSPPPMRTPPAMSNPFSRTASTPRGGPRSGARGMSQPDTGRLSKWGSSTAGVWGSSTGELSTPRTDNKADKNERSTRKLQGWGTGERASGKKKTTSWSGSKGAVFDNPIDELLGQLSEGWPTESASPAEQMGESPSQTILPGSTNSSEVSQDVSQAIRLAFINSVEVSDNASHTIQQANIDPSTARDIAPQTSMMNGLGGNSLEPTATNSKSKMTLNSNLNSNSNASNDQVANSSGVDARSSSQPPSNGRSASQPVGNISDTLSAALQAGVSAEDLKAMIDALAAKSNVATAPVSIDSESYDQLALANPAAKVSINPAPTASANPAAKVSINPEPPSSASTAAKVSVNPASTASASPAAKVSVNPAPTSSASPAAKVSVSPAPKASASPEEKVSVNPAPKASASPAAKVSVNPASTASASPAATAPTTPALMAPAGPAPPASTTNRTTPVSPFPSSQLVGTKLGTSSSTGYTGVRTKPVKWSMNKQPPSTPSQRTPGIKRPAVTGSSDMKQQLPSTSPPTTPGVSRATVTGSLNLNSSQQYAKKDSTPSSAPPPQTRRKGAAYGPAPPPKDDTNPLSMVNLRPEVDRALRGKGRPGDPQVKLVDVSRLPPGMREGVMGQVQRRVVTPQDRNGPQASPSSSLASGVIVSQTGGDSRPILDKEEVQALVEAGRAQGLDVRRLLLEAEGKMGVRVPRDLAADFGIQL